MRLGRIAGLALRNISSSVFRSLLVFSCSLAIAGFLLATILVVQGADDSLRVSMERLGADIVVVQNAATAADKALLIVAPAESSLPGGTTATIADLAGVAAVSPQLHLGSLSDTPYLDGALHIVAFDPATDFSVQPWIDGQLDRDLAEGEALAGSDVVVPEGRHAIALAGSTLDLRGRLHPTGTELDRSILVTFETARELARSTVGPGEPKLTAPANEVSAVMVRLEPDKRPQKAAVDILRAVSGVTPVLSPDMFAAYREQIQGLSRSLLIILLLAAVLALAVLALVFSLAAHQRRRQVGVLRALGATRGAVVLTLLLEAGFLALAGAIVGIVLAGAGVYLVRDALVEVMSFPFAFPSLGSLAPYIAGGLCLALIVVGLAALGPAVHVGRKDPASSMRE